MLSLFQRAPMLYSKSNLYVYGYQIQISSAKTWIKTQMNTNNSQGLEMTKMPLSFAMSQVDPLVPLLSHYFTYLPTKSQKEYGEW